MLPLPPTEPVDYLILGHLSCDLTPSGPRLGGTAAYAALTARALGLRVGVVTVWGGEVPLDVLDGVRLHVIPTERSTSFENIYTPEGRIQYVHHVAPDLLLEHVPEAWRKAPIVHIGPIAGEGQRLVEAGLSSALLGLTPQGWMRAWDDQGRVHPKVWKDEAELLPRAGAVIISVEDVLGDELEIEAMAESCRILAVTEGAAGARLFWNGDRRRFHAPDKQEVDATGAGDIFATAFFWRLYATRDPWAATRFATQLASFSVTRPGLQGVPTAEEIQACLVEVI
jgi:sugar/nucleoside kinase (ribokinase family)